MKRAAEAALAAATKLSDHISDKLEINTSTLSGAIDVIVVTQEDGSLRSSPFHVRFGKLAVLKPNGQVVSIVVNDRPLPVTMRLGYSGEAYFVAPESEGQGDTPSHTPPPIPTGDAGGGEPGANPFRSVRPASAVEAAPRPVASPLYQRAIRASSLTQSLPATPMLGCAAPPDALTVPVRLHPSGAGRGRCELAARAPPLSRPPATLVASLMPADPP
jgi:hypothetical protein